MFKLTKNLYTVQSIDSNQCELLLADKVHPVFKAHFEYKPLLPAFLQIDIFAELLQKRLIGIEKAKFKIPIFPNDTVIYQVRSQNSNCYLVNIIKESQTATELKLIFEA